MDALHFVESNILIAALAENWSDADRQIAAMTNRELRELHLAVMRLDLMIDVEFDRRKHEPQEAQP